MRTRLSDATTEYVQSDRSQGLATMANGEVLLGDCQSVSLDCYSFQRYVRRYSDGVQRYLPSGSMGVVPTSTTPTRRTTWGSIKTLYR